MGDARAISQDAMSTSMSTPATALILVDNVPCDSNLATCPPEALPILRQYCIPSLYIVLPRTWDDPQLVSSRVTRADDNPVEFDMWDMCISLVLPSPSKRLEVLHHFFVADNSGGYTYNSSAARWCCLALYVVLS
jgi:hypothetical protein